MAVALMHVYCINTFLVRHTNTQRLEESSAYRISKAQPAQQLGPERQQPRRRDARAPAARRCDPSLLGARLASTPHRPDSPPAIGFPLHGWRPQTLSCKRTHMRKTSFAVGATLLRSLRSRTSPNCHQEAEHGALRIDTRTSQPQGRSEGRCTADRHASSLGALASLSASACCGCARELVRRANRVRERGTWRPLEAWRNRWRSRRSKSRAEKDYGSRMLVQMNQGETWLQQ